MSMTDKVKNREAMARGDLYYAFTPDLTADRRRCERACELYNTAPGDLSRRKRVELWKDIVQDSTPLPPEDPDPEKDSAQLEAYPWVQAPVHIDYGTNLRLGPGVFLNFNCTMLDTCTISIGARTLIGPNVSLYSGTHPLDPAVRNGTAGPELGREVHVGADCWIGGNAIILPGVTLGRGVVVGAGSVVTKNVPDWWVVAGNPARMVRKVETRWDPEHPANVEERERDKVRGAEGVMAEMARDVEMKGEEYHDDDQGW